MYNFDGSTGWRLCCCEADRAIIFLSFSDASSSDALAPGCVGCRSNKQSSRLFMSCACCVLGVVLGLAAREDAGNSSSSSHADTHLLLGVSANACGCCCPEASWLAWASQSTLTPHTRRCVRRCATLPEGLCGSVLACACCVWPCVRAFVCTTRGFAEYCSPKTTQREDRKLLKTSPGMDRPGAELT